MYEEHCEEAETCRLEEFARAHSAHPVDARHLSPPHILPTLQESQYLLGIASGAVFPASTMPMLQRPFAPLFWSSGFLTKPGYIKDWVAVKERKYSYHNGCMCVYIYIQSCIENIRVGFLQLPQYSNSN